MDTTNNKHLHYLDELSDYKIVSEDPDVRGWEVKDLDGRIVGKIDNLLVNTDVNRVRYLDVEVDASVIQEGHKTFSQEAQGNSHEYLNKEGENHLIVPIGLASLDKENEFVIVNDVNHTTFSKTKRIEKRKAIHHDYELNVMRSYRGDNNFPDNTSVDDSFYERDEFNKGSFRK